METKVIIEKNAYHDSVTLMSLSGKVLQQEGVVDAVVSMATDMNKDLLENVGMSTKEAQTATENDLIIAVKSEDEDHLEQALDYINDQLTSKKSSKNKQGNQSVTTFKAALNALPEANMAVISVPGEYAAREARQALNNGLNVMLFSDNVSIEDERELKLLGAEKKLLVMGPDCGTAMINQTGLCFANDVEKGAIGLVAASGTGLQEVAVQIDRLGYGITHAIGTGGRDLHEKIGGIMMLEGLELLNEDEGTKVITLISKPPAKSVQDKILKRVKEISKPVVICFLDGDKEAIEQSGAIFAPTLIEGARQSILALDGSATFDTELHADEKAWIDEEIKKLADSQKYLKGLFCGGTLTAEALSLLREEVDGVKSNVAKREEEKLKDVGTSDTHILLDMGDDVFTKGKPHPMIEPNLRNERILQEARNENTAVLLLDFEIGYGSHEDPVGESFKTLKEAQKIAEENGRSLPIVAYICGTDTDKQGLAEQESKLRELGAFIADSNEKASKAAGMIANKEVV
ncbi:acyl-CoA synthetase FdrA [Desemzia sp. C1]|uniref:acyl-CoA synthetase FdrA n=1 Tax=Desemzia sp. C1 TaxID=2892016 RepID=UPI001E3F8EC8|nr:acyl-CoA synthetase FdrA [Desemzia sp. C1]MCI3028410.1 acyl-CoA synthetase FdrA [Desemzia sp. C1]